MRAVEYRGFASATMRMVLGIWVATTVLLLFGYIQPEHWVTVTMGGVFGWVLRDGVTKASEAYRDKHE